MRLTGRVIKLFDCDIQAEIEIDINDLYKILKAQEYYLLSPHDSRNPIYQNKVRLT